MFVIRSQFLLSVTRPRDAAAVHVHFAVAIAGFVFPSAALGRGRDAGLGRG
jgi:hypothetical protein